MSTSAIHLDHDRCAAVVRSKDPRYDGWFVTGVLSTRIYCRPSCPAITPKVHHLRFYPSAAAAQGAGFRACKRCLPDATPGSPLWHVRGDVVARAVRLVADGVVDREGVGGLARRLGYSTRQLERLVSAELGAGPLALARAQRAQAARLLLEGTTLRMADVAHAAGFSSIRSFNDTVREVYAATPSQLRAGARRRAAEHHGPDRAPVTGAPTTLTLRLPFRGPLHAPSLFGHLVATAVPGIEAWTDGALVRSLRLPAGPAVAQLRPSAAGDRHVHVTLRLTDTSDLAAAIGRCRRMLDLDADPVAVDEHLADDPALAPLVAAHPGVRLPGSPDPDELALRVVLSQQVSTVAAGTLTGRLVASLGEPLPEQLAGPVTHLFPTAEAVAAAADDDLPGTPASRQRTLRTVAAALADGELDLGAGADRSAAREAMLALPGVGPWTAEMVLLRGMGDPDAFPATDLGVQVTARAHGLPGGRALVQHASGWRPWRSYATALLWAASDHAAARLPAYPTPEETP
ncbi:Methylated-DNA--protein-cysteine methyltransferase [Serinicoccus hydrothermalis]|uniref:DNA-3-methyladenine glycosylase II n=1 Tax=Serinicoccus hydrothermalis TaxID=1758689 RepID=A0A1B1NBR4_9MICO|nr:AlkA N-terminal domain-containing protein [Serinicoccus hydrothermalis]ANS78851.1 Methylated-DNA--protein-cysteine methyltransferase [Serinicoccus hydrothermalis]